MTSFQVTLVYRLKKYGPESKISDNALKTMISSLIHQKCELLDVEVLSDIDEVRVKINRNEANKLEKVMYINKYGTLTLIEKNESDYDTSSSSCCESTLEDTESSSDNEPRASKLTYILQKLNYKNFIFYKDYCRQIKMIRALNEGK
jgi:hypothetical protein